MIKSTIIAVFIIWCIMLNTATAQDISLQQKRYIQTYSQKYLGSLPQWTKIMEAIRLTECNKDRCGKSNKQGDNSWGGWQLQPNTARDVMGYLEMKEVLTDEQIIHRLIYNNKFSTQIAVRYFAWLFKELNNLDNSIIAYNIGIGNVIYKLKTGKPLSRKYLNKVKSNIRRTQ